MKNEQAAFAKRLRKLIAGKNLPASPKELAALLARYGISVTPQTVSGWLNGTFMPRIGNLRALATLLEVDLQALHDNVERPRGVREAAAHWTTGMDGRDALAVREFAALPKDQRRLIRELIAALSTTRRERD